MLSIAHADTYVRKKLPSVNELPWCTKAAETFSNHPASNQPPPSVNHMLEDAVPRGWPVWLCICQDPNQGWSLGPGSVKG